MRKKKNLNQLDVAKSLGVTTSYYGMIEQGVRTPSLDLAAKIAKYFDRKVEDIFFANENNKLLDEDQSA
ncbi:transcriptional regulator [Geosporobacter ferrireducens]|uniref:Transcriptional regulator n=2 Tax=Geosporobacter ferrireducens TaxID=1424294 RepID=A0A1D8GPR1_9FIRM|nr:transcriptional regulator [Geosporobacter ferrireducens]MTI53817.1 helix-turn-helix domain-containing protein [Geosporobacter ferrireducens]